ncbi:MAG: glycosyltransferase family 2 protein [Alphaproteobacteria bacterium]|nr:glycosyltransferase family 2 protein [Alphaproteobacteria bacterium]
MDLSVVIPMRNEAGNAAPLLAEIRAALDGGGIAYEVVCVDDGSTDATASELAGSAHAAAAGRFAGLRLVRHAGSFGQSAAIRSGVQAARGRWIATLDGDGQNDPADIPKLWAMALALPPEGPVRMLAGMRVKRRDTWSKRWASRAANAIRSALLGDDTRDTGCGLKLFRRDLFLDLPYFAHMHRFLPALVKRQGFAVVSVPVNHRPRLHGRSNYGNLGRALVGIVDILGVMWLQRRARVPKLLDDRAKETG